MGPHHLGRWQQVLAAALTDRPVTGVRVVVERHLGRQATRSEITAARRAAHLLERAGQAKVHYVAVPATRSRSVATARQWTLFRD